MAVLEEIIDWAGSLALWQQEAVRILLLKEEVNDDDFDKLLTLCKEEFGILQQDEIKKIIPISPDEFPSVTASKDEIKILAINSVHNVNALDGNSCVRFNPVGLTIIYGDNGAGKSSYSRIIKSATRSRGQKNNIVPNIYSSSSSTPKAKIIYSVNGEDIEVEWQPTLPIDSRLSAVSFFDADCAEQYVQKENSVAYLPFGLDLFDKLASTADRLKRAMLQESFSLESRLENIDFNYPGTRAAKLLNEVLEGSIMIDELESYSKIDEKEKNEIKQLHKKISVFNEAEKLKQLKALEAKRSRIQNLNSTVARINSIINEKTLEKYFEDKNQLTNINKSIELLTKEASRGGIPAVGERAWMNLWEAAREYSELHVHTDAKFPVTNRDAKCVLCFQILSDEARERFKSFDAFVNNKLTEQQQEMIRNLSQQRVSVQNAVIEYYDWENLSKELSDDITSKINHFFTGIKEAKKMMGSLLGNDSYEIGKLQVPSFPREEINAELKVIDEQVSELEKNLSEDEHAVMKSRLNELLAKEYLTKVIPVVIQNVDIKRKVSALRKSTLKLNTSSLTRKGMELTRKHITEKLCQDFESQLERLRVGNVKVKMVQKEGRKGVVYHEIQLESTKGEIKVGDIASDGEQRGVAIAGFLSELSTADHKSGIIFDDPVSSLDHKNRDTIAKRLVEESKDRQVIIFTHDMFFVMLLNEFAEREKLDVKCFEIVSMGGVAGIAAGDTPWMAMTVSQRFNVLNERYSELKKTYDAKQSSEYNTQAKHIYGLLRETWERAVEEVLFNKTVQRFDKAIHTMNVREITKSDKLCLDKNMSKCSGLLSGHDDSPHHNGNFPEPTEVRADIDELITWVTELKKRR